MLKNIIARPYRNLYIFAYFIKTTEVWHWINLTIKAEVYLTPPQVWTLVHITPQLLNRVLHPLNYHKPNTWPPMVVFQGGFGDVTGEVDQTWCRGLDLTPWTGWGGKGMHLWLAGMWDRSVSDGTSLRKGTRAPPSPPPVRIPSLCLRRLSPVKQTASWWSGQDQVDLRGGKEQVSGCYSFSAVFSRCYSGWID